MLLHVAAAAAFLAAFNAAAISRIVVAASIGVAATAV
jgi:hypothetical protein